MNKVLTHLVNFESYIENLKKEILALRRKSSSSSKESIDEILKDIETTRTRLYSTKETKEIINSILILLKDGGIKSQIIKQYIPHMNKLINKYLQDLDFFVQFNLDENFNETILSRNHDIFSYASFSEGEKARINLSLLFAWRAIAKSRNSIDTNLIIFDEVFDGNIDANGSEDFMKVLNTLSGCNSIVISHRENIQDKFDRVLRIEKHKNFTRMK